MTDPRRVALVLGIVIAILGLLGAVRAWAPGHGLEFFDLDGERNAPATFSALLLFTASFLTLRLPGSVVARPVSLVLAALFLYAGLDEAFEIHEKLEAKIDIDWELLYVPGFLVAVVALGALLYALRSFRTSLALVLAAMACWFVSQLFEALEWDPSGPTSAYVPLMVAEELLEMTGSSLLILALLVVHQDTASRRR